ncbi:MAG TPA: sigma-70 family RNA polymerase sigma factor [Gemmataceae bacterium]|nr:sigma-70 family RNA polymerase sigma factor [Gemmataceae bacterium]
MNVVLRHLRRVAFLHDHDRLSDGQLLEQFLLQREEAAFEALVRRHGAMVLGVCRRVLRHEADAEDAFQATFLVLVRKAGTVQPRDHVGHWLYGVAYRTALRAKALEARRRMKERAAPRPQGHQDGIWQDVLPLLDQELSGLPEKYRIPVVLCDLEGKSRKEVARILGCLEGTLSSRLARARTLLARRLCRRGVILSGGALASVLSAHGASSSVPVGLVSGTIKMALPLAAGQAAATACVSANVLTLTEGVLKAMLLTKVKTATVILCGVAALGMGTGGMLYRAKASDPGESALARTPASAHGVDSATSRADDRERQKEDEQRSQIARAADQQERALREELERARREAEKYRQEAKEQRERTEAERLRADKAVHGLKLQLTRALDAEQAARLDAEKEKYEGMLRQAGQQLGNKPLNPQVANPTASTKSADLDAAKAAILRDRDRLLNDFRQCDLALQNQLKTLAREYDQRLQQLNSALKDLDQKKQKLAADMERERGSSSAERREAQAKRATERASSSGDKLDLILQRLERMEERLERLERSKR